MKTGFWTVMDFTWTLEERAIDRVKHETALCSTFSCLETSQTRNSAGFHVSLPKNQISLQFSFANFV
ncbi:hypothetical protein T265_08015 [Opisthorchis viverrini]|uniref:Uncharacterized protein n=1 Tax=Opisthorchis viverrini TaxID=6198 RepID=A0A074ZAG8_OPIVI|nr:hypothetical protein T265_08015 [Opisthorchis viverrini]KER24276.1 hypothetical protein T265_08015 [Opisthorchis viverrini]